MRRSARSLAFASLLAGCGTSMQPPQEGGVGHAPTCDAPEAVTLTDRTTITRMFDLRSAPHSLTTGCGGGSDGGQVVYEVIVPGSGPHAIVANTGVIGTDRAVDTVISLRRDGCAGTTSDQCWDDNMQDRRARADFLAMGGDHVFVIVAAFSAMASGPYTIAFTASPNTAPTIQTATALLAGDQLLVDVTGMDPDGNAWGVDVRLHGPAGELIDLDGDGVRGPSDVLDGAFARSVSGAMTFAERARFTIPAMQLPRVMTASSAYVRLLDEPQALSQGDVPTPLVTGSIALAGQPCDAMDVCSDELNCSAATPHTCTPTATRLDACNMARPITIPTPTMTTTSMSGMGTLTPGTGVFTGDCAPTFGNEDIYLITVPRSPAVDLVLTTEAPGSDPSGDTVIYVRGNCVDPATEMTGWCNDDDTGMTPSTYLSRLVIPNAQGSYSVFVEAYQGVQPDTMLRYELAASLRPVLPSGAPCDPAQVMNRCATTMCSTMTRMCP